jgi:hypothetical protein
MKEFLLYVWQLPQNILARFVIVFSGAITIGGCNSCIKYCTNCKDIEIFPTSYRFGVSLGKYIIVHFSDCDPFTIKHEYGHTEQSKRLGWLYLIVIGIPSAIGNIYDRIAHKKWTEYKRKMWYYKQPWEAWANKLAGINIAEEL